MEMDYAGPHKKPGVHPMFLYGLSPPVLTNYFYFRKLSEGILHLYLLTVAKLQSYTTDLTIDAYCNRPRPTVSNLRGDLRDLPMH